MERIPSAPDNSGSVPIDKSSTVSHNKSQYQDNVLNNRSGLFQKFDLDEDSYWEGLNNCFQRTLRVSNKNMSASDPSSDGSSEKMIDDLVHLFSDAKNYLRSLKSTIQHHIQILKEEIRTLNSENARKIDQQLNGLQRSLQSGLVKIEDMIELISASVYDLNMVQQLQGEIINLTTRDCFRAVRDDFEGRWCKQRSVIKALNQHWQEKVQELDFMQKELHELSRFLMNSENSSKTENSEDRIISKFKDNVRVGSIEDFLSTQKEENGGVMDDNFQKSLIRPENRDFSHVKFMTKEEIIIYFRTEMINMRRQHDLVLQKKTEELFRYKREIPKGLSFVRKDKEFESLRKRITDVISKLDEIRSKKIEVFVVSTDQDEIRRLESKADSLYYENQHLKKVMLDTNKEVKKLSYQLSNKNVKIEKIRCEREELEIEGRLRDEMYNTILGKVVDECSKMMEGMNENFRAILVSYQKERSSLETKVLEKEKSLFLANEENKKLHEDMNEKCTSILANCQKEVSSLEAMVVEKDKQLASANEEYKKLVEAMEEKCKSILVNCQKERSALETTISEKDKVLALANEENKRLKRAVHCFLTSPEKDHNLVDLSFENKRGTCENDLCGSDDNLGYVIMSMMDLSKKFSETEGKLSKNINRSENRLECLSKECKPLVEQAASMRKNVSVNQQLLDITFTELHNAEHKVYDMGKEVDALLRLLQKIYITISRYSPVLQYHPELLGAFMKTCNLVTSLRSN